ncbi:hypothetical protein ACFE04_013105 [Oxalis oulophora]
MKHKLCLVFLCLFLCNSQAQLPPNITGYTCNNQNQTNSSCQAYAYYRATSPDYLDLASIGDLFAASRVMISEPSNISDPSSRLIQDQSLFIPLTCGCHTVNDSYSISYANLTYRIQSGDTFYFVSTGAYQNLTTYQSVEIVNPSLVPEKLEIGQDVIFPIFCKCPNKTLTTNFLISYVFQLSDSISSVASKFGVNKESITDINGDNIQTYDTIFVPVTKLPGLNQPIVSQSASTSDDSDSSRKAQVVGLSIGLGICALLLVLVCGVLGIREFCGRHGKDGFDEENHMLQLNRRGHRNKEMEVNLLANVSDCLDKYRVFDIEELKQATNGFNERNLIQGCVYKGEINGDVYAIKKMKWDACDELKILQKVNHGNLVKLEGFCIDPDDASCFLIYEYIENGSLHSWLHDRPTNQKLNWKTRLRIAIDVANGLQYIHEHTIPRVVHKDIKSSNILLDENLRAKIANFGLAKSGCNAITMHIVGTQGYIAPEYLADGIVSTKMDVFSYGVVLLELLSGKEAIDEEGRVSLWSRVGGVLEGNGKNMEKLRGFVDEVLIIEEVSFSMDSVVSVLNVAAACLQKDPMKRPSMVDIVYALCKSDDLFFDISGEGLSNPQVTAR